VHVIAYASMSLDELADMLEVHTLDGEQVSTHAGWKKLVLPVTEPFLRQVREALTQRTWPSRPDLKRKVANTADVAKRQTFDGLYWNVVAKEIPVYAGVLIGMADELAYPEGVIAWGLYGEFSSSERY
jgi:hypothetical protein